MTARTAIVVPCYNEERRLQQSQFVALIASRPDIDFWFVDDGSTDNTLAIIIAMSHSQPDRIHPQRLPVNSGKAEAVRQGMLGASRTGLYRYIGFIDADLSAPLEEIGTLRLELDKDQDIFLAAGVRVKVLGRIIIRNNLRYYISRIFTTYYNSLLKLPNYDTQCGLKIFNQQLVEQVFENPFFSKWLFDIELFLRVMAITGRAGYARHVREIPLNTWIETKGSKLRLIDFIKAPMEILKLYRKYKAIIRRQ